MALVALGLTGAPVHEPVHGRPQATCMVVTQRSGRDPSTAMADLTIWLGEIRDEVERLTWHCRIKPHLDQGGAAARHRVRRSSRRALPRKARPARPRRPSQGRCQRSITAIGQMGLVLRLGANNEDAARASPAGRRAALRLAGLSASGSQDYEYSRVKLRSRLEGPAG
jgi:hypothetical protein